MRAAAGVGTAVAMARGGGATGPDGAGTGGALGDTVTVVNPQTQKAVAAIVTLMFVVGAAAAGAAETALRAGQTATRSMAFPSLTAAVNTGNDVFEKTNDVTAAARAAPRAHRSH